MGEISTIRKYVDHAPDSPKDLNKDDELIIQEALREVSDVENDDSEMEIGDDDVYIERATCESKPDQYRLIPNVHNAESKKRKSGQRDIFLNRAKKIKQEWYTKKSNTGVILSRCDPPEDADESYDVDNCYSSTSTCEFDDPSNDVTEDVNDQRYTEDFLNQHGDNTFRNYMQNLYDNF